MNNYLNIKCFSILLLCSLGFVVPSPLFSAEKTPVEVPKPTSLDEFFRGYTEKNGIPAAQSNKKLVDNENSEWVGRFVINENSTEICALKVSSVTGNIANETLTLNIENAGNRLTFNLPLNGDDGFEEWRDFSVHHHRFNRWIGTSFKLSGKVDENLITGDFYGDLGPAAGNYRIADVCAGKINLFKRGTIEEQAFIENRDPRVLRLEQKLKEIAEAKKSLDSDVLAQQKAAAENVVAELEKYSALRSTEQKRLVELKRATEEQEQKLAALRKAHNTTQEKLAKDDREESHKLKSEAYKDFGDYHALVIGIDKYRNLPMLKTAIADATAIAGILESDYGFKVMKLINPSRADILDSLDVLRSKLSFKDNLLIYYSGHGSLDSKADEGYWLPVNARQDRRSNWLSNNTLTATLRAMEAKHVMVVADSCYSGRLTRGISVLPKPSKNIGQLQKLAQKKARVVMTSGGLKPVEDDNGSGHSPFAYALLKALKTNNGILEGAALFKSVHRPVQVDTKDQEPQYSDVRRAGHAGGDFIFIKKK